jgi:hypothetical protein
MCNYMFKNCSHLSDPVTRFSCMIIKMFRTKLHFHCMFMIMKVSQINTLKNFYHVIIVDRFGTGLSLFTVPAAAHSSLRFFTFQGFDLTYSTFISLDPNLISASCFTVGCNSFVTVYWYIWCVQH